MPRSCSRENHPGGVNRQIKTLQIPGHGVARGLKPKGLRFIDKPTDRAQRFEQPSRIAEAYSRRVRFSEIDHCVACISDTRENSCESVPPKPGIREDHMRLRAYTGMGCSPFSFR